MSNVSIKWLSTAGSGAHGRVYWGRRRIGGVLVTDGGWRARCGVGLFSTDLPGIFPTVAAAADAVRAAMIALA